MGLRKLILLSLVALPLSLGAETASDYINRGAQKYIFGHEDAAKAEVDAGLAKFPDDPELREMLALFKKKPPQDQKNDNKDKDKDKSDQDKSQQKNSRRIAYTHSRFLAFGRCIAQSVANPGRYALANSNAR